MQWINPLVFDWMVTPSLFKPTNKIGKQQRFDDSVASRFSKPFICRKCASPRQKVFEDLWCILKCKDKNAVLNKAFSLTLRGKHYEAARCRILPMWVWIWIADYGWRTTRQYYVSDYMFVCIFFKKITFVFKMWRLCIIGYYSDCWLSYWTSVLRRLILGYIFK